MLESKIVADITEYLNKYNIRYATEIHMGIGIPDVSINIGASKKMHPITDYYLLSLIEYINNNKSVTIENLMNYFSYDKVRLQNYLNQLFKGGIIKSTNDKITNNRKIFDLNLGKTISIEAKIKDWKNGVLQAQRYLMFSDYSYLALPQERICSVDTTKLIELGIGLLSVCDSGLKEVIPPKLSTECDYKQKYIATSSIMQNNISFNKRKKDSVFSNLI